MEDQTLVRDENLNVKEAILNRQTETKEYSHGDYVPGENGEPGGILIDHEEEIRRATENPHIEDIKNYLSDMDNRIAAAEKGIFDHDGSLAKAEANEQQIVNHANPSVPEFADIHKVSEMFKDFEPTASGLAPANSKEAIEFKEKMEMLEKGEINLEDYDKAQIAEANRSIQAQNPQPQPQPQQTQYSAQSQAQPEASESKVVQFNVDSKDADRFMTTLSPQDREKVTKTDTIIVNEIKTLDIPVATRTITSMTEFKKVLPRQSHSETVETVNINSGYVAVFKGCGALALATLIPDQDTQSIDYAKRMAFCYENLVDTSIGKLSYNDFCARTHINDVPNMLFAILRASDPDENVITLECAGCGNTYDQKYRLSELLDMDSVTDEMSARMDEIIQNRSVLDNAMRVHQESSVMTSKCVQIDQGYQKVTLELKAPNATKMIELTPMLRYLIEKYSRFVAGLLPYISSLSLTFTPEGETTPSTYQIVDIEAMAEIVRDLDKTCIQAIGHILEDVEEFDAPTYSFKGHYKCPHCGRIETKVPCTVDSLIFYRVEQAIR